MLNLTILAELLLFRMFKKWLRSGDISRNVLLFRQDFYIIFFYVFSPTHLQFYLLIRFMFGIFMSVAVSWNWNECCVLLAWHICMWHWWVLYLLLTSGLFMRFIYNSVHRMDSVLLSQESLCLGFSFKNAYLKCKQAMNHETRVSEITLIPIRKSKE